jgi:long-chain acyl-CoA synthetase
VLGNNWWAPAQIELAIDLARPKLIIVDRSTPNFTTASQDGSVVGTETVRGWIEIGDEYLPPTRCVDDEDSPAVVMFTSGTTGLPKPIVLAHRSIIANLQSLLISSGIVDRIMDPMQPQAASLLSAPLFHIGGLQPTLLSLLRGNRLVFTQGRFDVRRILELIEDEHVTWWGAVPTMASRVVVSTDLKHYDLTSVRDRCRSVARHLTQIL